VVEVYNREIRSITVSIRLPSVIRLLHYVKVRRDHAKVKFSRHNLYVRDHYCCQYCRRQLPTQKLTYDHVIPVARGGGKNWENIVTSCVDCNRKKANRTPEEAGLRLLKKPKAPMGFPTKVHFLLSRSRAPDCWKAYIFWSR
jgi:5-methylcytosine-specific restriction endonuclease McrA